MAQDEPVARLSTDSAARPEAVYDLLTDLHSHLRWGGAEQRRDFRLLSMDAPEGPATVGTVFTTTGTIPMSTRRWIDRSTVTVASRPTLFEFVTEARAGDGERAMTARFVNRYEIAPSSNGSTVTYTQTQRAIANPVLRLALPVVRQVMWRFGIPMFEKRGLRNLLRAAEAPTTPPRDPSVRVRDPTAAENPIVR